VQLITDEANYARLFPESVIPGIASKHNAAVRQSDHFEIVKHSGQLPLRSSRWSLYGSSTISTSHGKPAIEPCTPHSLTIRETVWS
jgi:hypothetical protein